MTSETSVHELELSARAANALSNNQIETIAQLTQLTPRDLLRYRNCGKRTIKEIQTQLERNGFSLVAPDNDPRIDKLKDRIGQLENDLRVANRRADYFQEELDRAITELTELKRLPSVP